VAVRVVGGVCEFVVMHKQEPRVLYLEDEDNDILLLRRAFARAGLRCKLLTMDQASDAINYLRAAATEDGFPNELTPSLILTDVKLVGSTGFEFIEWLQVWPQRSKMWVVVFSSSSSPEQVRKAKSLGVDDYIEKPNDFEALVEICSSFRPHLKQFSA
jgi:CheY-like chemotaxis protein